MKKYMIDHHSHVPLHAQVELLLREMSTDEEYKKGKFLPNEVELAKKLGISRNTLRQATSKLVYEGVLVRKKGIGTKFTDPSVNTRLKSWSSFSQEMKAKGIEIRNYEINVNWVYPDREVALSLEIQEKTRILKMERLRGTSGGPFVYFISFFHPRIGLTGKEDFTRPLYETLEKLYSTLVKVSREQISAIPADRELAQKLNLKPGQPILKRKRMVYDPGNRPVEYNIGFYRGDSFIYTIESEREL
ncbi:MAG: GntR family transcriptional regulator [Bacteroidales bacterium]